MKNILPILSIVLLAMFGFTASALAQGVALPADGDLLGLARQVFDSVMHGQWWLGAAVALMLAVTAFKRYAPAGVLSNFAQSDAGGAILVLLGSLGGALATALLASGTSAVTWAMAWMALKVAVAAAGGYSLIKKLVVEPLMNSTWYQEKAPAWLKQVMALLLWVFLKPAPTEAATVAGDSAVAANPPEGANGVAGEPTDL